MNGQVGTVRVALAQLLADTDPELNLAQVRDSVAEAARRGARIVVFPEATMARFGIPLGPLAQSISGPWASAIAEIAEGAGVLVVAGMFTPSADGRVRNTLLIRGRGLRRHYDKIHLYDAHGVAESETVAPGDSAVTFGVDGVTFGVATCYDLRFPAIFRHLASAGAAVILVPASWGAGAGKISQWELLVRARALDSTSWLVACDQADPTTVGAETGKAPTGVGHSMVATPTGETFVRAGTAPQLLLADIDVNAVSTVRESLPVLTNGRAFG